MDKSKLGIYSTRYLNQCLSLLTVITSNDINRLSPAEKILTRVHDVYMSV